MFKALRFFSWSSGVNLRARVQLFNWVSAIPGAVDRLKNEWQRMITDHMKAGNRKSVEEMQREGTSKLWEDGKHKNKRIDILKRPIIDTVTKAIQRQPVQRKMLQQMRQDDNRSQSQEIQTRQECN